MIGINRNILALPVYLLGNLKKEFLKDLFNLKNNTTIKEFLIEDILTFISSLGKKEFMSFPKKGSMLFRENVQKGLKNPEIFIKLLKLKENKKIYPLLFSLTSYREVLILIITDKNTVLAQKELKLLKLYFKERINYIYREGQKIIKEGEEISSLLYLLHIKDRNFLEKIHLIFNITQKSKLKLRNLTFLELLFAILIYDLGKLFFKETILSGAKTLDSKDRIAIFNHPLYSTNLIKHISGIKNIEKAIEFHHENYNGTGYPFKIRKDEIPEGARFLRILDTIGALYVSNIRKENTAFEESIEIVKKGLGKDYDPYLGKYIISLLEKKNIVDTFPGKYIGKKATIILKKYKNKTTGEIIGENKKSLKIRVDQYFTGWNKTNLLPPLPGDNIILRFSSLDEELEAKVIDVNFTTYLQIEVDISQDIFIDIRKNPRVPWTIPVEIFDGKIRCLALTTDISSNGAQIIPLGKTKTFNREIIEVEFRLPPGVENGIRFQLQAEVIRYSKGYKPPFYKIIKFVNIKREQIDILKEFIYERQLDILFLEWY